MSDREALRRELHEAELALQASEQATRTHGRQGITWALLKADARRVKELRQRLAEMEHS